MDSQLFCGDALEGLATLPVQSVDVVLVDGPYALPWSNIGFHTRKDMNRPIGWDTMPFEDWRTLHDRVLTEAARVLRPGGQVFLWSRFESAAHLHDLAVAQGLTHRGTLIYRKRNPPPSVRKRTYRSAAEMLLWAVKGTGYTFHFGEQHDMTNVWDYPVVGGKERAAGGHHPTAKPVALTTRLLTTHTDPGELVVIPFAGSGSECVAAHRLGRQFLAWERDPTYYAAARAWLVREGALPAPNNEETSKGALEV